MFERCIYFNSNALTRYLNRRWDAAYGELGLTAPQAYLLRAICQDSGVNQQRLAVELHLEKSTITRLLNMLVGKKLILRQAGDSGREVRLQATDKGDKLCRQLDAVGEQLYQEMRKRLGAAQFDMLLSQLRTGIKALE